MEMVLIIRGTLKGGFNGEAVASSVAAVVLQMVVVIRHTVGEGGEAAEQG